MSDAGTTGTGAGATRAHSGGNASFTTRAISAADSMSSRTFDRFASTNTRSPGVSALSFSDRLMQPYFTSAREHRDRISARSVETRPVSEDVTWLFPVPWYSDELSWLMSEARRSPAAAPRSTATRAASSGPRPASGQAGAAAARPRSFSPLVPLAAVSAAELVADLLRPTPATTERSPMADLVGDLTMLSATAWNEPSTPAVSRRPMRTRRPVPMARPATTPTPPASTPRATDPEAPRPAAGERVRAAELLAEVARSGELEKTRFASAPPVQLRPQLFDLDDAIAAVDVLEAPLVRYVSARPSAATPARAPSLTTAPAAPPMAPASRWVPRSTVAEPAAPARTALASVSERPKALGHMAWADRWLARFAGASPATLGSLEPTIAVNPAAVFDAVFVAPSDPEPEPRAGQTPSPAAQPTTPTTPTRATPSAQTPVIPEAPLDDEPVPDEVFAAISAQLVQDRKPGAWVAREHQVPPARAGVAPSALAQRALATPIPWNSPGLRAGLGSSPVMPALSATLDAPVGPTFDVRALALPPAVAAALAAVGPSPAAPRAVAPAPTGELDAASLAPEPVYVEAADGATEPARSPAAMTAPATSPRATAFGPATPAATSALVRRSPTPGAVGQMARSFGITRALAASDLAYDFVPPEVISAARVYGFDAHDAVRAMRLADAGEGPLAALKDAVAMTFVEAVSPSVTDTRGPTSRAATTAPAPAITAPAPAVDTAAPGLAAPPTDTETEPSVAPRPAFTPALAQAADALPADTETRAQAQSLVVPRRARGATLWPEMALAHLGIHRGQAQATRPAISSALEVLAAGAVADAAVWVQSIEPGLDLDDVLAPATAAFRHARFAPAGAEPDPVEPADPQLSLFDFEQLELGAPEMVPLGPGTVAEPAAGPAPSPDVAAEPTPFAPEAGAAPAGLTSAGLTSAEFAAAGFDPGAGPDPEASSFRGDAPWVRAAVSALPASIRPAFESIYAVLAGDPQTRALPPAERAARALAVARRSTGDQPMSARTRAAMAWTVLPTVIAGGSPHELASAILGVGPLVGEPEARGERPRRRSADAAPGVFADPLTPIAAAPARRAEYAAPTAAPTLVRTGPTAEMYREAASQAAQGSRTAQAAMPTMAAIANTEGIPDWFLEAARSISGDTQSSSSSSSGISLAEMTLVTASPAHSIAASPRTAAAPSRVQQGGPGSEGQEDQQDQAPDLENMVFELAAMLRDYFDFQRIRNGES